LWDKLYTGLSAAPPFGYVLLWRISCRRCIIVKPRRPRSRLCSVPAANSAFKQAREVFAQMEREEGAS
jgi:hypothetical protein